MIPHMPFFLFNIHYPPSTIPCCRTYLSLYQFMSIFFPDRRVSFLSRRTGMDLPPARYIDRIGSVPYYVMSCSRLQYQNMQSKIYTPNLRFSRVSLPGPAAHDMRVLCCINFDVLNCLHYSPSHPNYHVERPWNILLQLGNGRRLQPVPSLIGNLRSKYCPSEETPTTTLNPALESVLESYHLPHHQSCPDQIAWLDRLLLWHQVERRKR